MRPALTFLFLLGTLIACNSANDKMQTTPSGIRYQIIHLNESGKKAPLMATAKVAVRRLGDDKTIINGIKADSIQPISQMPIYQMVLPPAPFTTDALAEIMVTVGVREGDSIITVTKDNKKTAYTIERVYTPGEDGLNTDSIIAVDKNQELKQFTASHSQMAAKRIGAYLSKNNITATKTDDNVFVQLLTKGTGPRPDSAQKVGIHFTIKHLYTGKIINSNTDTAFHQPPVLEYQLLKGFMLKPVDRTLMQLAKGGRANVYIPAALALGAKAAEPNADLKQDMLFEVELVSVNSR